MSVPMWSFRAIISRLTLLDLVRCRNYAVGGVYERFEIAGLTGWPTGAYSSPTGAEGRARR